MKRDGGIVRRLKDKRYRELYVSEHIDSGVAFQIHAIRTKHGLTQAELAERAGMHQSQVSELEDPDNEGVNISTLKRVASALDVALVVRFVSFGELVEWERNLGETALAPDSFDNDARVRAIESERSSARAVNVTSRCGSSTAFTWIQTASKTSATAGFSLVKPKGAKRLAGAATLIGTAAGYRTGMR